MPKPLGQLLELIAQKTGVDTAELTDLFQLKADIKDDVFAKIETGFNGLIPLSDAKHNNELHKHFKALSLNPIDKLVNDLLDSGNIDDETVAELKANTNSYERTKKLIYKLAETKPDGKPSKDAEALKAEIKRLNDEVLTTKSTYEKQINDVKQSAENSLLQYQYESILSGKNYVQKDLPKDVNVLTAKTLLEQTLKAKGAKIVRTENGLKLVNAENPELDYTEQNKIVSFNDFVDSTLASNKLLQVSAPSTVNTTSTQTIVQPKVEDNPAAEANAARLARLEEATKN